LGTAAEHLLIAEAVARGWIGAHLWDIIEVLRTSSTSETPVPCPIPIRDSLAIEQLAAYDWAWAVYPATGRLWAQAGRDHA
jgi:hypothetical protein